MVERVSKEILRKIDVQRKLLGMTQAKFSLGMEKGIQWFANLKRSGWDFKVPDWIKAGQVLNINPLYLLPDDIVENLNNENIETAIKVLTEKGYRVILEESEQKQRKGADDR